MKTIDYFVTAHGVAKRRDFLNYLIELGYKINEIFTEEYLINSLYPFAICISTKTILIIESATQCYLMDKAGKVLNIEAFKKLI